jgi:hypothetical protein
MTIKIDLPPDAEARLERQALEAGEEPDRFASRILQQQLILWELQALRNQPRPRSIDDLKPRIPTPPGRSWLEEVSGKWPGDETDEEIYRALEELS